MGNVKWFNMVDICSTENPITAEWEIIKFAQAKISYSHKIYSY